MKQFIILIYWVWVLNRSTHNFYFIACIKWGCRSLFHYDLLSATKQSLGNISLGKEWDWEFYSRKSQHLLMMRVRMPPKQSDLDGVWGLRFYCRFPLYELNLGLQHPTHRCFRSLTIIVHAVSANFVFVLELQNSCRQ